MTAALDAYRDDCGFELDLISPADAPRLAVLSAPDVELRLFVGDVAVDDGVTSAVRAPAPGYVLPPHDATLELSFPGAEGFGTGRASMAYRDLLPCRQGGRFIASHIRIAEAGPVPDYVHFHRIRFQMIYCLAGWVRVVYEGQGPPFVLEAGDCVLQPPEIRHRVLESSAGLEVLEVGCPAQHATLTDRGRPLPTSDTYPERLFGGQRFARHVAADAPWQSDQTGLRFRDVGLNEPTGGLATVRTVRGGPDGEGRLEPVGDHELYFLYVHGGEARLSGPGGLSESLAPGAALALPSAPGYLIDGCSNSFEAVEVIVPGPR